MRSRFLFPFLLLAGLAFGQSFPIAMPTDSDLYVASNRAETRLSSGVNSSTLTLPVDSANGFEAGNVITIENERIKICTASGATLTACAGGRGFGGSTAASHVSGRSVRAQVTAEFHNRMRQEVRALAKDLVGRPISISYWDAEAASDLTGTVSTTGPAVTGSSTLFTNELTVGERVVITGPVTNGTGTVTTARYGYSSPEAPPYLRMGVAVTGSGTLFTSQVAVNDIITINGQSRVVVEILSNTSMRVYPAMYPHASAATTYTIQKPPSYATVLTIGGNTSLTLTATTGINYPSGSSIRKAPDNYAAIVSALSSGRSVYFPPGDYYIENDQAGGQTIFDGTVRGDIVFDRDARLIFTRNDRLGFSFRNIRGVKFTNWRYKHMRQPIELFVIGLPSEDVDTYTSFGFKDCEDITIEGLWIENGNVFGLNTKRTKRLKISNALVELTSRDGITTENCDRCTFDNLTIRFTEDDCFGIHHLAIDPEGKNSTVNGLTATGCSGAAVIDSDGYRGLTISNVTAEGVYSSVIVLQKSVNSAQSPEDIAVSNVVGSYTFPSDGSGLGSGYGIVANNVKSARFSNIRLSKIQNNGLHAHFDTTIADSLLVFSDISLEDVYGLNNPAFGGSDGLGIYMNTPGASLLFSNVSLVRTNRGSTITNASDVRVLGGVWRDVNKSGASGSYSFVDFTSNGLVDVQGTAMLDTVNPATAYRVYETVANGLSNYSGIRSYFLEPGRTLDWNVAANANLAEYDGKLNLASRAQKFKRVSGCTTAASVGAACDTTLTWTGSSFADISYTVTCTIEKLSGVPYIANISNKTSGGMTITTAALTAAAAQGDINCIAFRD